LKAVEKNRNVPEELLSYLGEWWMGHILNEDMKYKSHFEEKGVR
jgi:hemerythrin